MMDKKDILDRLNGGLEDLRQHPGADDWTSGWDCGWKDLAQDLIAWLSEDDNA